MAPQQLGTLAIRGARTPDSGQKNADLVSVVIRDGVVSEVLPVSARLAPDFPVIEANGRILMPGFIDAHSHAEGAHGREVPERGLLRQGLTGAVIGQDGVSFAPTTAASAELNNAYFSAINGPAPQELTLGGSVADLLQHFSTGTRFNTGYLVPAGTVRSAVAQFAAGSLSDRQLDEAADLTRTSLAEGAVGISLGLEYVPNGFADERELHRYASIAAAASVPIVSHMRGYELSAPQGLSEMINLAKSTGAAIHIAHLHAPANLVLPAIDTAIASGVDLTFDSYPYRRGNTILAMLALPSDLQQGGAPSTLAAISDPTVVSKLAAEWFPTITELLSRVTISSAPHPDWSWVEGMTVPDASQRSGLPLNSFVLELLAATRLSAGAIVQQPASNRPEDVREIANHSAHLGSTDGIFLGAHPHPRGWGGFARLLARHVIEWGDWSWADAAEHLSFRAAARFGLGNRGRVQPGSTADFCLVDPEKVRDIADYDRPTEPARGIMDVLVAGVPVLAEGELTCETPGRGLRRENWSPNS